MDRRPRVGGYILRERIRAGSNGAVFRSGNPFGRLAVTLVADDALPEAEFLRRAEVVASLRHKSIAPLYDFGADDGCWYFVTRYMDGATLASSLATEGRLPPVEAAEIASDILDGLSAAHRKRVVHGGLTLESVLVSRWARAVITDMAIPLNLPREEDEPSDAGSTGTGREASIYSPPEQLRGGDPDPRWDIYAVGAMLFEMLTGTKPAAGPEWPPRRIEAVNQGLEAVVLRALAPEPGDRFSTAAEMRTALRSSSQRWSALGEAMGDQAPETPPLRQPATSPVNAGTASAGPKLDAPPGGSAGSPTTPLPPPALSPRPNRGQGTMSTRPASRTRRRQYKHQAPRRARRPLDSRRWRPVMFVGAVGAGAILALFIVFALSIFAFLGAGAGGEGASTGVSSTQPERSRVPDLSGKTVGAAAAELRRAGLELGEVTSAPSGKIAPERVLEQDPSSGDLVGRNTSVDVVVATEPPNR